MKNLLTILVLAVIMFGCSKNIESEKVQPATENQIVPPCKEMEYPGGASKRPPRNQQGPASKNILYLDFYGGVVTGTSWNFSGPIVYAPCNLDAAGRAFVLARVQEAYDTLNVTVTADSVKYNKAKPQDRQRLILTPTYEWFGMAGGVAFINSFGTGDPAWVFSSLLNLHNVGEASCHELGHTLSLYHQSAYDTTVTPCIKTAEYRFGPIMGVSYYVAKGWWDIGPGPYGCETIQNDLQQMGQVVGFKR